MNFLKTCFFFFASILAIPSFAIGFVVKDTNVCANTPFLFKDTSTPPAGLTIINRNWNFDGVNSQNSTVDSIYFTYSTIGQKYTVTLLLTYSDNSTQAFSYPLSFYIRSQPQIDSFIISDTITCPGIPIFYRSASSSRSPHGGILTNWNIEYGDINGQTLLSSNELTNYSYSAQGAYTAIYKVRDQFGCEASASKQLLIIAHPKVSFEPINLRCKDSIVVYENRTNRRTDTGWNWSWTFIDSAFVLGSQGQDSAVNWSARNYNSMNAAHQHPFATNRPSKTQMVILYGQNKYKCFDRDTQYFKVDTTPILVVTPSIDTTICFGNSVQYTVRGSDTLFYSSLLWADKIKGDSIILFTPKNTYTYTVYGKTPQCPPIGKNIKIRVVQPIATNITLTPANILRGNRSIMELNTNAVFDSIQWNPNSSLSRPKSDSTGASPLYTTYYKAKVFYSLDNYVCYKEDSAILYVDTSCQVDSLSIPTAFTPNGDNLNDEFYVKSFSLKTVLSFNIYNRWGDRVFKIENVPADDKQYGWNGKINNTGEDLPTGVYIYNISAICANNQVLNFQGEITILR